MALRFSPYRRAVRSARIPTPLVPIILILDPDHRRQRLRACMLLARICRCHGRSGALSKLELTTARTTMTMTTSYRFVLWVRVRVESTAARSAVGALADSL